MKKMYLLCFAGLVGCTSQPHQPLATSDASKTLITIVADYSKSYQSLVALDSNSVTSLVHTLARTGGTIVHIPIADNSASHPVYMQRIERLDTTNATTEQNLYAQARMREQNRKKIASFSPALENYAFDLLKETRSFTASQFSDIEQSLQLAQHTVCGPLYTTSTYSRYVLILSDVLNEPPHNKHRHLSSVDFCNATVLIVRPSSAISQDSLDKIFSTDVHVFTTINDAITFIHQQ